MALRPEISDWARAVVEVSHSRAPSRASAHAVGTIPIGVHLGASVDPHLTRALSPLSPNSGDPWTVHAHTDLTDDMWAASPVTYGDIDGRGAVTGGESGDIAVSWNASQRLLTVMDRSTRTIVHTSAGRLPVTELGGPLRTPLHWITAEERQVFVHAGAVEVAGRAILIIGPSGAGKSSLTLQGLQAGFRILGDDYVIVSDSDHNAQVLSAYRTVKVPAAHLDSIPLTDRMDLANGKVAGFLPESSVAVSAPLGACVVVDASGPPMIEPVSPARAVRSLAASTVMQAPLYSGHVLSTVTRVLGSVPCYRLGWVTDADAARKALEGSVTAS